MMASKCVFVFCALLLAFAEIDASASPSSAVTRRSARNRRLRQLSAGITRCNNNHNVDNKHLLRERVLQAELVFTGKVDSEFAVDADFANVNAVYGEHKSKAKGDYRGFVVRVKRVLKGYLHAAGGKPTRVQLLVGKAGESDDTDKYSHICYSVIRVHHTAIFLAKRSTYMDNGTTSVSLESTADPLPITLWNLDQVNAFVKDMTYKPRPPLMEEPCERKYCPWGSDCVTGSDGATAHCECPVECAPDSAGPVCGTDDVTYENQCHVRRKACLQKDNTRIRHSGECGAPAPRRHPHA